MDDFPDNRCEHKRLDILKRMYPSGYIPVAGVAPSLRMADHVREFQQLYTELYGHPADLISNSTDSMPVYQLLRGYLLGKGYTFVEIDAPDGLWPLIKAQAVKPPPRCCVCGTTENVTWIGGSSPWKCPSLDCVAY